MELKLDGVAVAVPPFAGASDQPVTLKLSVNVPKPGPHTLTMRVANPLAQPEKGKDGKPVNRRIVLRRLELISPPQPVKAPEAQLRIFAAGRGQPTLDASARAILSSFASRAFRRPLRRQRIGPAALDLLHGA